MPPQLREDYYDAIIFYSEEDTEDALKLKENLVRNKVKGYKVKCVLHDHHSLTSRGGTKLETLEYAFNHCTFVFLFLTKAFCDSEWCKFISDAFLTKAIENGEKKCIPVHTVPKEKADFEIPMFLNHVTGLELSKKSFKQSVQHLLGNNLYVRLRKESLHLEEMYKWACKEENRQKAKEIIRQKMVKKEEEKSAELEKQRVTGVSEYSFHTITKRSRSL